MSDPCYFKEGYTPQSGIDTITIWLHPYIITNPKNFHEHGNNNKYINLRFNRERINGTGEDIRPNYFVDIQAEAINPYDDIFEQVLRILVQITYDNILHYPQNIDEYRLNYFYRCNFDRLFGLDGLDFYFDLRSEDMQLVGDPDTAFPNTRYSSLHKAVLKAYFRDLKLRQKRHTSYEEIENMEYPGRIEFSLCRDNCEYLNILNLTGVYENVFLRYLPFLARKWLNYRYKVVEVMARNVQYAHHLCQIIAVAGQAIPHYNDLLKTPPKPIPYKSAKRNEVDYNFIAEFYSKM